MKIKLILTGFLLSILLISSCSDDKSTSPAYDNTRYTFSDIVASAGNKYEGAVSIVRNNINGYKFSNKTNVFEVYDNVENEANAQFGSLANEPIYVDTMIVNGVTLKFQDYDEEYAYYSNDDTNLNALYGGGLNNCKINSIYFGNFEKNIKFPENIKFSNIHRGDLLSADNDIEFQWTGGGNNEFIVLSIEKLANSEFGYNEPVFNTVIKNQGKIILKKEELTNKFRSGDYYNIIISCFNFQKFNSPKGKEIIFNGGSKHTVTLIAK